MRLLLLAGVVVALWAAPASAAGRACVPLSIGPAHFTSIEVSGTTCANAHRQLARSTLAEHRRGRFRWRAGGWAWRVAPLEPMARRFVGRRHSDRIAAVWSVS